MTFLSKKFMDTMQCKRNTMFFGKSATLIPYKICTKKWCIMNFWKSCSNSESANLSWKLQVLNPIWLILWNNVEKTEFFRSKSGYFPKYHVCIHDSCMDGYFFAQYEPAICFLLMNYQRPRLQKTAFKGSTLW